MEVTQNALNGIYNTRVDELCHDVFMQTKVSASAVFAHVLRIGHHPGPNPATVTSVRGYGHNNHRENGAYTLQEIKQLLALYPSGQIAVTIGLNAFLALRGPEVEALLPDDFDRDRVRIHRDTKTGNDEFLPVIGPLKRLLVDGWNQSTCEGLRGQSASAFRGSTSAGWAGTPSDAEWLPTYLNLAFDQRKQH